MPIEIRRKDVKALVAQGRVELIDVRSASEYAKEHLPGAINLPLEEMTETVLKAFDKARAIIVYSGDCQCDLSARAAWRLESLGFQEVYRYRGGQTDWLAVSWQTEGADTNHGRVWQMVQKDVLKCSMRERLQDVKSRRRPNHDLAVVVNDRNIVLGVIQGESWDKSNEARVASLMLPAPQTIRPHLELKEAQTILRGYTASSVIVTTSDGELLGTVRIAQKKSDKERNAA
jgi:rhodanese-related sulfurtransferase